MQQMQQAADAGDAGLTARLEDPAEQLTVLLEISRLKGVIAARLFDTNGQFVAGVPDTVTEAQLARDDLRVLGALKSVCRFRERASLADVLWDWGLEAESSASEVPLLEVHVPLHAAGDARLVGVAQFTIDGTSIAAEFEALDRHLHRQKILVFGVAGALVVAGLGWAFWRLARAQELLARRRDDLLRANNELALAAKHSALGAVAAHLVHGLRNPLAGLQLYLTRQATETAGSNGAETSEAVASTRRMQSLINDVVRVLREDRMAQRYEVRVVELCDTVRSRLLPAAREAEVSLVVEGQAEVSYTNREASLVLLILENLLDNAIQATPRGGEVRLRVDANRQHLTFEVTDHGPGLTEPIRASLFLPCRSTKAGGSGMGFLPSAGSWPWRSAAHSSCAAARSRAVASD